MSEYQRAEVMWYRQFGKHPSRVVRDRCGEPYVIGDWSWHRNGNPREEIEPRMVVDCYPVMATLIHKRTK